MRVKLFTLLSSQQSVASYKNSNARLPDILLYSNPSCYQREIDKENELLGWLANS
jgi:hypothetical protein